MMWGGLERLMMDWFERIDYSACRVTLAISKGGRTLFEEQFKKSGLPIAIKEIEFDLYEGTLKLFQDSYALLKPLQPTTTIFIQGAFTDFRLGAVLAGFCLTGRNNYMHENLSSQPPTHRSGPRLTIQKCINSLRGLLARKIIVVSQEIKDLLVKDWGYPKSRILVSYHGINLSTFVFSKDKRCHMRQSLNIADADFVFIVPARLSKVKRIERTIEAFDRLSREVPDLWLLILGEGDLKEELQALARQKQHGSRILFLGQKDNVADFLSASDCYVNSSDAEGLCIALLEAWACGNICIATRCAGPTELIQNARTGFLVDKSVEGIGQGMKEAVALNQAQRQDLIQKGLQFTREHFELNQLVRNFLHTVQIPCLQPA